MTWENNLLILELNGNGFHQILRLDKRAYTVGSGPECDIRVPGLRPEHAELRFETESWVIRRLDPDAEITYRGYPIELKKINSGDMLRLDSIEVLFRKETVSEDVMEMARSGKGCWVMQIIKGKDTGTIWVLFPGEYTIGHWETDDHNRINLRDDGFPGDHVRLIVKPDQVILESLTDISTLFISNKAVYRALIRRENEFRICETLLHLTRAAPYFRCC